MCREPSADQCFLEDLCEVQYGHGPRKRKAKERCDVADAAETVDLAQSGTQCVSARLGLRSGASVRHPDTGPHLPPEALSLPPLPLMGIPSAHQTLIHSRRPRGQVRLGLSSPRAQIFQQIAASGNISGTSRESSKRSCPDPTLLSSGNHIQRPTDSRRHGQELPICLRANHTLVRRPHHKPSPTSQIGG